MNPRKSFIMLPPPPLFVYADTFFSFLIYFKKNTNNTKNPKTQANKWSRFKPLTTIMLMLHGENRKAFPFQNGKGRQSISNTVQPILLLLHQFHDSSFE